LICESLGDFEFVQLKKESSVLFTESFQILLKSVNLPILLMTFLEVESVNFIPLRPNLFF
jgi:hypothetical protein